MNRLKLLLAIILVSFTLTGCQGTGSGFMGFGESGSGIFSFGGILPSIFSFFGWNDDDDSGDNTGTGDTGTGDLPVTLFTQNEDPDLPLAPVTLGDDLVPTTTARHNPEPATLALFGLGALGAAYLHDKKKRKK